MTHLLLVILLDPKWSNSWTQVFTLTLSVYLFTPRCKNEKGAGTWRHIVGDVNVTQYPKRFHLSHLIKAISSTDDNELDLHLMCLKTNNAVTAQTNLLVVSQNKCTQAGEYAGPCHLLGHMRISENDLCCRSHSQSGNSSNEQDRFHKKRSSNQESNAWSMCQWDWNLDQHCVF